QGRSMTLEQVLVEPGLAAATPSQVPAWQPLAPTAKRLPPHSKQLTKREVDVLRLVAQGMSDIQVAEQLVISPRTVNTHLTSIYEKLGVTSCTAAAHFAVDHQLL